MRSAIPAGRPCRRSTSTCRPPIRVMETNSRRDVPEFSAAFGRNQIQMIPTDDREFDAGSGEQSDLWLISVLCQISAARCQTGDAPQLVVATDLRTPFVVPAAARRGVEPQAALGRFLATEETSEMLVNFANELCGESGRAKGMLVVPIGPRGVQSHWRSVPLAAQAAGVAVCGLQHVESNGGWHELRIRMQNEERRMKSEECGKMGVVRPRFSGG